MTTKEEIIIQILDNNERQIYELREELIFLTQNILTIVRHLEQTDTRLEKIEQSIENQAKKLRGFAKSISHRKK